MNLFQMYVIKVFFWQITLWVLLCPLAGFAQKTLAIDTINLYSYRDFKEFTPATAHHVNTLAKYLVSDCKTESCKIQMITNWIATNIKFDYNAYTKRLPPKESLSKVLQDKKALSIEYAELFKEMCLAVDIAAVVVTGYTQKFDFFETDTLYRAEHAWSAVRLNGEWRLLDLTYGSGQVELQKQPFKKFMALNFGLNFLPKYKYVQEYNPNWFYIAPDELIFTHFPNLEMFQLLETPVSINTYMQGSWAIYQHFSWHYKVLKESEKIDAFVQKTVLEKWLIEGEEGLKVNKYNHLIKGRYYYYVTDSLFRANYSSENQSWKSSKEELIQLEQYLLIADSMFALSLLDNTMEFRHKRAQSKAWQLQTLSKNAAHILKFKLRKKKNLKQSKLIDKIYFINLMNQKKALKKIKNYSSKAILKIKRPLIDSSNHCVDCLDILKKIDSLRSLSSLIILQKDSLLQAYSEGIKGSEICSKEALVLKIHKGNNKALKVHLQEKKENLPLVYNDYKLLNKSWLTSSQGRADSLNRVETDSFLKKLYIDQEKAEKFVVTYQQLVEQQLVLLQELKKKSPQDFRENWSYSTIVLELELEMKKYQQELQACLAFQKKLNRSLVKGIHYMNDSEKTLERDSRLEGYRHKEYVNYRKFIKNTENQKIEILLQKTSELKSFIKLLKQKITY